ncbi:MAG TPA: cell surface protein SprA [Longimicrobiales bacterium]
MQRSRLCPFRPWSAVVLIAGALAATFSPARAQEREDSAAAQPVRADSLNAWMPEPAAIFLGQHRVTPPPIRPFLGPRLEQERLQLHWTDLSGRWWHALDERLASARDTMWLDAHGLIAVSAPERQTIAAAAPDTIQYLPYNEVEEDTAAQVLPGVMGQYADLGMLITGRGEMGSAWQQYEPCDALGINRCDQGLRPRMQPDLQFGVLLGGTITDRVHVAVDYDQTREFDAANNINVYYQGLEDEILQRFEMGDVSITLPQSQFLTGGIPGGNFGFRALAQVGPVELQSVWAQQQGDVNSLDLNIDARTGSMYEESSLAIDDHAYASGRFFFLVDPAQLPGYPHIDVLTLDAADAPAALRPIGGTVQIYRDEQLPQSQREASRVFAGRGEYPDGSDTLPAYFRRLDFTDYVVHSSGLWIMLRQPLGPNESLAMSYVTETGDTVGTLNATFVEGATPDQAPVVRLLRGPMAEHHPQASTWAYEMHQVYQVYAGILDPADLNVQIRLGDANQGQPYVDWNGSQVPLLRLFGLDEEAPVERVDERRIFLPSEFQLSATNITGTYLVFPTLRPFADPPPTRNLSAADADAALGDDANHRIYEDRDPDQRATARFRMVASYRVRTDGLLSEFSLNAFGVREGSERILVDGVALRRGTDYTVDYATGLVRLSNPQQIFGGRQTPRITAEFEQASLFEIAPKSIFGTTARWRVGSAGEMNVVGLYQNQRSVMARPQLGNEPHSVMMGGVTTNLRFDAGLLDRALDAIPGLRLAGESSIGVNGELAMSLPNPNTRGMAFLEDFEATAEIPLPTNQNQWRLGSRPESAEGLMFQLTEGNAMPLVWQHQAFGRGGGLYGALVADSIDRTINTRGGTVPEGVLYVTMHGNDELPPSFPAWRSMTTVLSTRGADLTSSEYLEFYAVESTDDIALVLDIGTVSEDAFFIDSLGATGGTHPVTSLPWGLGTLDQEARYDQPWGRDIDHGIWDQGCRVEPGAMFFLGSRAANCTVNNGLNDTEDLNGDGVPQLQDGAYFRYVVPIGPNSPYLARDRNETRTLWRLYRVPLRDVAALAVNNAGEDTWRAVKHLRMTVTAPNCEAAGCGNTLFLARMSITGSTWKKRDIEGVIAGMIGRDTIPGDHSRDVHVGPVSQVTDGTAYANPPGTREEASDPSQEFAANGIEVNEKALRLIATELEPDARAEVFTRFPADARSFMEYQQMRLWAMPRAGDWGDDGTLSLLVKIGMDDGNYYLYRTPLRPPIEHRNDLIPAYWRPEIVIDFAPWFRLKADAETAAANRTFADDTIFWDADSTYAIVLSSRAQAPNLAAIREMSIAVHNGSGLPADSIEVWINDIRLGNGRTDAGYAGYVSIDATAADFATMRLSLSNRNAMFHPLNQNASLQGTNDLGLNGRFEMGHFAPAGWGLSLPVTVQHTRQGTDPAFLNQSDIRAADLEGLRESGGSSTNVGVAVSKRTPAANRWLGLLIDGARLSVNWQNAEREQFTQSNSTSQFSSGLDYEHQLQPRTVDVTPGFFVSFLRLLAPSTVERSEFFNRVANAQLRWSPASVGFSTSYVDRKSETLSFPTVMRTAADDSIVPLRSPQEDLRNSVSVALRPFESLTGRLSLTSTRDLLATDQLEVTPFGERAVDDERARLGGMDLGWEKSRTLGGSVAWQPRISAWLRPSVTWTSDYQTNRTPHQLVLDMDTLDDTGAEVDTLGAHMRRNFQVNGQLERRLHLDPAGLARALWGAEPADSSFAGGALGRTVAAIMPFDVTWTTQASSLFERSPLEPGYGYRFGLGDLDDLRLVGGDTASNVNEQGRFQVRSGVRLPLGMQLDLTYQTSEREAIARQGSNNAMTERTWPDVRLGISALPLPAALESWIARVNASAGYRVENSDNRFGSSGRRLRETQSIPVQFSTTFANGLTGSYSGSFGSSEATETTGRKHGRERVHGVQLRYTFDPPGSLGEMFTDPLTASVGYNYMSNNICEVTGFSQTEGAAERCADTVDRLNRDVHLTLETMIDDLNVGAQFSLNEHKSFIGTRDSTREFRLAIFANFNFGIGVLPQGMGAGGLGY